jgi:hypothetical protein
MDDERIRENEQALRHMTKEQEQFLKKNFQLSKQDLILADDVLWEETLDRLFDMEIDNENHASEKTARRDRIVSDLITMMTEEA